MSSTATSTHLLGKNIWCIGYPKVYLRNLPRARFHGFTDFLLAFNTDIEQDYASVLNGVQCLSANWRKIGLSLGVSYNTVDAIEGERKKASDMLMDLLAVWLRRESEGQPKPTWKKLCEAVSTIDRTRAEVLAQEHQCDCPVCLGNFLVLHLVHVLHVNCTFFIINIKRTENKCIFKIFVFKNLES